MSDLERQVAQLAKAVEALDKRLYTLEASVRSSGQTPSGAAEHSRRLCQCASCRNRRKQDEQRRLRVLR